MTASKQFFLRTYGCQMNVHDSEKIANLLYHAGYVACENADEADILIINTCSIREKVARRLYSDLGMLRAWKAAARGRVLGVAGCVAQQDGDRIQRCHRPTTCGSSPPWSKGRGGASTRSRSRSRLPSTASTCPSATRTTAAPLPAARISR